MTETVSAVTNRTGVHVARQMCELVDDYIEGYEPEDMWAVLPIAASWPTPNPLHDLGDKEATWT